VLIGLAALLAYLLLLLPVIVLLVQAFSVADWMVMLQSPAIWQAIWLSGYSTVIATAIIVLIGTPLAWVFSRWDMPARRFWNLLIELPIVMPPAVAGLALLLTFGRQGVLGSTLQIFGVSLPFSTAAVIVAQIFVSMPLYVRAAQIGFQAISVELQDAARMDGASEGQVFRLIILPLALRSLLVGMVTAWARAMGEFGATILFAGSLPGRTQTLTLLVYAAFERDIQAAIWTGGLLVLIAIVALLIAQWLLAAEALHAE
jgi:molybdate transport system permease protein